MKRTLLIVGSFLLCLNIFAQTEIPMTEKMGSSTPFFEVYAADYSSYDDASVVGIVLENKSGASREGWGVGQVKNLSWGDNLTELKFEGAGATCELKYTIADLKAWGAATEGFLMNMYNDCVVKKVLVYEDAGGGEEPGTKELVFNFDGDDVGQAYNSMHGWGWSDAATTAKVVANPKGDGNSLEFRPNNYDGVFYVTVTLPAGSTVADLEAIKFDTYFAEGGEVVNGTIEGFLAPADATVGNGTNFNTYPVFIKSNDGEPQLQVGTGAGWYTVTMTRENILDASYNVKGKADFSTIDGASSFFFGLGLSMDKGGVYYLDNVTIVLAGGNSSINVPVVSPKVYSVAGGIKAAATNEKLSVYGIDGRLVKQTIANGSIISLNKGLYVVKVGGDQAVKVVVR